MAQGTLFTRDFLDEGIKGSPAWRALDDARVTAFRDAVRGIYQSFPTGGKPSEAQTEDDLIWPVLERLGWAHVSRQVNLSPRRMEHKPDGLLFADQIAKDRANARSEEWRRYGDGLAIVESKRWLRELDRKSAQADDMGVPSTQMIRYLDRLGIVTNGTVRWGILTNGRHWRLYYQGATSVAEEFLELDLPKLVGLPGFEPDLLDGDLAHSLRLFMLMFGRSAFLPGADGRTFHQFSRDEGRLWESRIASTLSDLVFGRVFPDLVRGIVAHDPRRPIPDSPAYLDEARDAALILLYRLLFVLYAEDRELLPARHGAYDDYGMSKRVREDIARRLDDRDTLSSRAGAYYDHMRRLFGLIDEGDSGIGLPPYNGGLFASDRPGARILQRVTLPDAMFAPIIDALSRHDDGNTRRRINYRDLSVQQLGSIYERLLENEVRVEDGGIVVGGDGAARHASGSFYTPEAPVQLIIAKAVGPLLEERLESFRAEAERLRADTRAKGVRLAALRRLDPAQAMLEIKVCDPAMGSGHFLVSLVDYLGDRVQAAIAEAAELFPGYESPLVTAIAGIRDGILANARAGKWTIDERQLEDRLIVRRMILKRVVYGVDKNPMAVELAKLALWLHTLTVGAPLSFLEHHLRCGDSICGEWVRPVENVLLEMGASLFIRPSVVRARQTAQGMAAIERLSDADIAEVRLSKDTFETVREATEPLARFLDLMHARRWIGGDLSAARDACAEALARRNAILSPEIFVETAHRGILTNTYGDPIHIATGAAAIPPAPRPKKTAAEALPPYAKPTKGKPADYAPAAVREVARGLVDQARQLAERERFLHWQVAFPGVWDNWESDAPDGGFDAVIGNPPYVRQELLSRAKPFLKEAYKSFDGMADLYVYFYELGLKILRPGGRLSLIVTNKWMKAGYAEALRTLFAEKAWVEAVVDFGHAKQIFPDADVFPCVVVVRKPTLDTPPDTARVCVIDRERLDLDRLIPQVDEASFAMPRAALAPAGWHLEPPAVLALMDKIRKAGVPLAQYIGAEPLYGLKTGFNDAFLIDQTTRDRLVGQDGRLADIIRPYLRGQDIERWAPAWDGLWMIVLKSSVNHPWPWADATDEAGAEASFRATHSTLHAHMKRHETRLRAREDQGRFWWELRACAYYESFASQKIFYQEIQFHPSYAFDDSGLFGNNKIFFLPSSDHYLLGVLNSPLMWWHNWRHLPHMKDEALTPMGVKMETLPISQPTDAIRSAVAEKVARLIAIRKEVARAGKAVLDWLRLEFDVVKPGQRLQSPAALTLEEFQSEVRKGRKGRLTVSALSALTQAHTDGIAPARALLAEANTLERQVSDLVNQAYGLTADEVDLMWRTAPPRMPTRQ
ncbi:MAG: Eco57I restriction-modification methylase domain-containing protein [Alphaproteobacteria bacterium]|nr:Eco57I restriction-modification methylase domain-containing protein [Alphaproteobacteria bacterium]